MAQPILTHELLKSIVEYAISNNDGNTANYIPELANIDAELTGIAVSLINGQSFMYCNRDIPLVTLQSTAKMIPLIGLLEEFGSAKLFEWVKVEPSGDDFASITRLEQFGPKPSNPFLNAGAITLCSHIPGVAEQQFAWLENWVQKLFNQRLPINPLVFTSEKRTGNRNRSLAYLLKSSDRLGSEVDPALDLYFSLCSYEATLEQMLYLPTVLANAGCDPVTGERVISPETCKITLAIMATCGLYDQSGTHLVKTGMPAKSGVSGYIIAAVPGKAGVSVISPRVNAKGNSIRGEIMLEKLSEAMNWHFALP
ncbi:glutaminase A [Legionella dresdenensis]|uniref:Glutaminase n=1 Tax=Legionella dresdenensis TaxID=450200 RepID=A0ABV8CI20_9GAMM